MIRIITDSASDLTYDYAKAHDVTLVPLYISYDQETYFKDDENLDYSEYYHKLAKEGVFPYSSLPSIDDFYSIFEEYIKAGDEVICLCMTITLSGTYNSAVNAMNIILDEYPDAHIKVYDSMQNTISQGLVVMEAVRMRDDGLSFDEMNAKLPALLDSGKIFFTVGSLDYLRKGGRIGKLATTAAGKLNLRPLLILEHGKLGIGGITRTRKKSIDDVINYSVKYFNENGPVRDYVISCGYCFDEEEAVAFRAKIEDALNIKLNETVDPSLAMQIGPVTATHTGPYALGIGICKKYELV